MKTMKFLSKFKEGILSGTKTNTWRLFDDKDLTVGDNVGLVDSESKQKFAYAVITTCNEIALKDVELGIVKEKYGSYENMYERFKGYYGDKVGPETILKIVEFKLL